MALVDTSLDAFQHVKTTLGTRQRAVLDIIKHLKSPTNTEISRYMGLPINQITPRVNELRKKCLVGFLGKRKCTVTSKIVYAWKAI